MIYESPQSVLSLAPASWKSLLRYRQSLTKKKEACGVLIGEAVIEQGIYHIARITTPMLRDIRTRTSFKIKDCGHQNAVNKEWTKSSGTRFYLGFWHTHPEPFPSPSRVDLENWKENYLLNQKHTPSLFYPIIGLKEISIWEYGSLGVTKMNYVSDENNE